MAKIPLTSVLWSEIWTGLGSRILIWQKKKKKKVAKAKCHLCFNLRPTGTCVSLAAEGHWKLLGSSVIVSFHLALGLTSECQGFGSQPDQSRRRQVLHCGTPLQTSTEDFCEFVWWKVGRSQSFLPQISAGFSAFLLCLCLLGPRKKQSLLISLCVTS